MIFLQQGVRDYDAIPMNAKTLNKQKDFKI